MFWVYENWVAEKKAVIHRSDCGHCRDGAGSHPNIHGDRNGRWHGPFDTYDEASVVANVLEDRNVRDCGHCRPSDWTSRHHGVSAGRRARFREFMPS